MRTLVFPICLGLGFIMTVSSTAGATPNFPPAVQQNLALAAAPDCSICHTDGDQGGLGTVNTPFGKNMRARGLVAFDANSLATALDQMASEDVNSAGDCLDDIDELKAGHDPNEPDPVGTCGDGGASSSGAGASGEAPSEATPTNGCAGKIAPTRSNGDVSWMVAIGFAWLAARRMKRASAKRKP
jgi:hypothetical protein